MAKIIIYLAKNYHQVFLDCDQVLNMATHIDATPNMKKKNIESFSTYNIKESEKERIIRTLKAREAAKTKATSPKPVAKTKATSPKPVAKKKKQMQIHQ